ncbi:MAG: hypothetical protein WBL58_03455 [Peptococcia bacterium]
MKLTNDFSTLYRAIEEVAKQENHNFKERAKFAALKDEILNYLKSIYGEASREYGMVRFTKTPSTVLKVMNHIASKALPQAANM